MEKKRERKFKIGTFPKENLIIFFIENDTNNSITEIIEGYELMIKKNVIFDSISIMFEESPPNYEIILPSFLKSKLAIYNPEIKNDGPKTIREFLFSDYFDELSFNIRSLAILKDIINPIVFQKGAIIKIGIPANTKYAVKIFYSPDWDTQGIKGIPDINGFPEVSHEMMMEEGIDILKKHILENSNAYSHLL